MVLILPQVALKLSQKDSLEKVELDGSYNETHREGLDDQSNCPPCDAFGSKVHVPNETNNRADRWGSLEWNLGRNNLDSRLEYDQIRFH